MRKRCDVGERMLFRLRKVGGRVLKCGVQVLDLVVRLILLEVAKRADARRKNRLRAALTRRLRWRRLLLCEEVKDDLCDELQPKNFMLIVYERQASRLLVRPQRICGLAAEHRLYVEERDAFFVGANLFDEGKIRAEALVCLGDRNAVRVLTYEHTLPF